jgi:hypothetical protein
MCASLICSRNTLYPKLQDHELVKTYPSVRGLTKDVFFLNHAHRENGDGDGDESSSKYNTYEVAMVKDLVLYLLRFVFVKPSRSFIFGTDAITDKDATRTKATS